MKNKQQVSLFSFFRSEKKWLILTAITGIIYNVGLTAGPLLEGQLAQCLYDILRGLRTGHDIMILSLIYVAVIAIIQAARALKRLYVRKFANDVSRSMKERIYHHLVHEPCAQAQKEDTGAVMTKAIADAEACAEGMRKFTTEIFDTGVVMVAYLVMLFTFDWHLTLIVILFPPLAYIASAALKKKVSVTASESKIAMSQLNDAAVDLAGNALTFRIYGEDSNRSAAYETVLENYEKKNVAASIWQNSPQPVYYVISMIGVIPILYFGGKNVIGTGWSVWTIASFTAYLSCFTKLATKSSHAAKLFNAVQKAQVSWNRIKEYLISDDEPQTWAAAGPALLQMKHVNFSYGENAFALHDLNLTAQPGQIIGITGKVASGKSTFGRIFLGEYPYDGQILYNHKIVSGLNPMIFAYAGHNPELFTGTIRENITFSSTTRPQTDKPSPSSAQPPSGNPPTSVSPGNDDDRLRQVLKEVQIDQEVAPDAPAGMEGNALSGGQQARISLARALYSPAPVLILDDPFAAVDMATERKIFQSLREQEKGRIILIISHRMALFPEMDQVIFLEDGTMTAGTHAQMMHNPAYAALYALQNGGAEHE